MLLSDCSLVLSSYIWFRAACRRKCQMAAPPNPPRRTANQQPLLMTQLASSLDLQLGTPDTVQPSTAVVSRTISTLGYI